jgi:predicted DNA binding protein
MGYYEQPRTTDLGAIADELGVSESAVSQRLNNAETKLVEAYLHGDIA